MIYYSGNRPYWISYSIIQGWVDFRWEIMLHDLLSNPSNQEPKSTQHNIKIEQKIYMTRSRHVVRSPVYIIDI